MNMQVIDGVVALNLKEIPLQNMQCTAFASYDLKSSFEILITLFKLQSIGCGLGGSNEYQQSMFSSEKTVKYSTLLKPLT